MARKQIDVSQMDDVPTKQNFEIVREVFGSVPFLKGKFRFFEFTISSGTYPATVLYKHNLNFVPKDVILLSVIGPTPTFNYSDFTLENLSLTTSGQSTIRAIIGTYSEN